MQHARSLRFNIWNAVEPYADKLLRDERGRRDRGRSRARRVETVGIVARLPRRLDGLATRIEDGRLVADVPKLDRWLRRLERMGRRVVSAVLFAGLLISGAVLRAEDLTIGTVLMIASLLPLLHALFAGFSGRQGPPG